MFELENQRTELMEKIEDLINRKRYAELRDLLLPLEACGHRPFVADDLDDEKTLPLLFRLLPKEQAAEVFVELESDQQELLIRGFSNTELKEVLDELYLDDTVDIVEEMPANVVKRILEALRPGYAQKHQRNSEISGGLRRHHHDHGVCGSEGDHDGGGRLEAHPPHRTGQGDHQRLLRH